MTDDWQLNPIHSGAFLRLQRLLPKLRGFRVLIMQHNNPVYRDGIIAALDKQDDGTARILDARNFAGYSELEQQLLAATEQTTTHIISIESLSEEEQARTFKGLNYHRELIAKGCQHTLLFWLPEPLVKAMVKEAADFWAWREQVFDFLVPVEVQERWAANYINTVSLDKKKKQQRIETIKAYLAEQQGADTSLTSADMLHELGNLYETLGKYQLAQATLDGALSAFSQLDERHAYAQVLKDKAYLAYKQGRSTEALETLQKIVFPWFVKLNNIHQQAETQGRIADIIQERGQFDAALRIRREEELPVYKKLGDIRGVAVTMGKIADIMQQRGQLDEALRIRRKEELPIFKKIKDVRAKAVTERKIADIQIAKGDLGAALFTLQEKCIPPMQKIGAIADVAVFQSIIANIMQARGQLDEACSIFQEEVLPVFEQLGEVRPLSASRFNLALLLWKMDAKQNMSKIQELMCLALKDARLLQIPETELIENTLDEYGLSCPENTAKD